MTELEIVVTYDGSLFSRLARRLGVAYFTHALVRYWAGRYYIIESGFRYGVHGDFWKPEQYKEYAVYRLRDSCYKDYGHKKRAHERMLWFAKGQCGKRYAFESLGVIVTRLLRGFIGNWATASRYNLAFGGLWGHGEVCSSLVDMVFLTGSFDLVEDQQSSLVTPDEIVASPLLERVE